MARRPVDPRSRWVGRSQEDLADPYDRLRFDPVPGHPNSIAPGKRVLWAGAPTLMVRGNAPLLAVGAPGGRKIMSAVTQAIVNVVDFGDGPQDAVNRPRVHDEGEELLVDSRIPGEVREGLAALGHQIEVKEETLMSAWFARKAKNRTAKPAAYCDLVNRRKTRNTSPVLIACSVHDSR